MFEAFIVFSSLNNSSITLWTHRGHSPFTRKWKYNIIYTYIWYVNSEKLCLKSFLKQPFFSDIPGTYMFVPNRFFYTLEFFLFPKVSCPAFPFILIFSYISFKGRSRYYRTTAWSCMRFAIPVAEESCYEGKGGGAHLYWAVRDAQQAKVGPCSPTVERVTYYWGGDSDAANTSYSTCFFLLTVRVYGQLGNQCDVPWK